MKGADAVPICAPFLTHISTLAIINTYTHSPGLVQFPFLSLQPSRQIATSRKKREKKMKLTVRVLLFYCSLPVVHLFLLTQYIRCDNFTFSILLKINHKLKCHTSPLHCH